jgi:SAM-dependent methyltransferase
MLEHIPDDRKAMRELRRILRPTGFGLLLVPLIVGLDETAEDWSDASEEYRWKHFGQGDHIRQYGRRDFVNRLTESGLKVDQLGIGHFGRDKFRRHGIAENSVLYVVRRDDGPR